jgi:modification methylase
VGGDGVNHDIQNCTALVGLKGVADNTIDVIFTSPPYNLKNSTGNGMKNGKGGKWEGNALEVGAYDNYDDNMPRNLYVKWQREVIAECFRVLKPTGVLYYHHKFRVQGGLMQGHDEILDGFNVRQMIIWYRSGGINFNKGYFLPTHEVIYMMPKTAKGKDAFKLQPKTNAYGDVWQVHQEVKNPHPAPWPLELPRRILTSSTYTGDVGVCLDPFAGSGGLAVAAEELGWNSISIEQSNGYCDMIRERLEATV